MNRFYLDLFVGGQDTPVTGVHIAKVRPDRPRTPGDQHVQRASAGQRRDVGFSARRTSGGRRTGHQPKHVRGATRQEEAAQTAT